MCKVITMEFTFKTVEFEGPLDLLLHLIKEADIDIFEVNIADITDQYLAYISQMKKLDLDIDSEYLVMAAELTLIKSKELLPHEEDEEEEDLATNLIDRLVSYQRYKEVIDNFRQLEESRGKLYSKEPSVLEEFKDNDLKVNDDLCLDDMIQAFMNLKERQVLEKPLNTVITKKEYSVDVRSQEILNRLQVDKQIRFGDLFDVYTKSYIVVTFLSILDLAKKGNVIIRQNRNLGEITLLAKGV